MTKLLLHHIFCTGTFLRLNLFTFAHFYSQIFTKNLPLKCCAKYTTPRPYKSKYTPKQHTPFKCILPHDVFFHGVLYCIRTTKYYTNPRKYFLKYSSISMQPTDGTENFRTMYLASKQINQQAYFNKKVIKSIYPYNKCKKYLPKGVSTLYPQFFKYNLFTENIITPDPLCNGSALNMEFNVSEQN